MQMRPRQKHRFTRLGRERQFGILMRDTQPRCHWGMLLPMVLTPRISEAPDREPSLIL